MSLKILNFTIREVLSGFWHLPFSVGLGIENQGASLSYAGPSSWYPQASAPSSSGGVLVAIKAGFERQKVVAIESSDIQADMLRLTT